MTLRNHDTMEGKNFSVDDAPGSESDDDDFVSEDNDNAAASNVANVLRVCIFIHVPEQFLTRHLILIFSNYDDRFFFQGVSSRIRRMDDDALFAMLKKLVSILFLPSLMYINIFLFFVYKHSNVCLFFGLAMQLDKFVVMLVVAQAQDICDRSVQQMLLFLF